jgi:hypothetical protein
MDEHAGYHSRDNDGVLQDIDEVRDVAVYLVNTLEMLILHPSVASVMPMDTRFLLAQLIAGSLANLHPMTVEEMADKITEVMGLVPPASLFERFDQEDEKYRRDHEPKPTKQPKKAKEAPLNLSPIVDAFLRSVEKKGEGH